MKLSAKETKSKKAIYWILFFVIFLHLRTSKTSKKSEAARGPGPPEAVTPHCISILDRTISWSCHGGRGVHRLSLGFVIFSAFFFNKTTLHCLCGAKLRASFSIFKINYFQIDFFKMVQSGPVYLPSQFYIVYGERKEIDINGFNLFGYNIINIQTRHSRNPVSDRVEINSKIFLK